ncbi:RIP metalloprotease [Gordonia sp. (in: high G+C Gram-positive bacteria)]|uniref:M50 family metallopeptidase n=1 Tax=Gordonia sp. (in: high G+C Gram-positive bacteria) TaxID=84139 RepID=UPI0016988F8A|nr:M50 family metallopeptidase [Gordonia sp. (in: high G+C Gram-positive bacteria)]NLG45611.1 site-2 protease family protein [Gordonia sp. (in: high G+C Gram-positive bacteria)]
MSLVLGVALFALALLISIAWHELGHMWAAQATGMKVRRYFVGFGPTVWSTRRGETEYGIKALPLGGFCDIAGMTPHEELTDDERARAMYAQPTWKRLVVLLAGPMQNFILGFALIVVLGLGWGLPIIGDQPVYATSVECVAPSTDAQGKPVECSGPAPAAAAGVQVGDRILAVDGETVSGSGDLVSRVQQSSGSVVLTVERDGQQHDLTVPVTQVQRMVAREGETPTPAEVGAIGVGLDTQTVAEYDFLTVWGGAVSFTGDIITETFKALLSLPSKVAGLWDAVTGGERAVDSPVSVVGASVLGGQAVERGYWDMFLGLLLSVNFFLGAFNLVPLLPLDGGHMAIALFEKARNTVRRWFGRSAAGPIDYYKLLPLTYAVVVVMGGFMLLTLTADIVNPIKVF